MGVLRGLPGVKGDLTPVNVRSVSAAMRAIRTNRAIIAAGDNGAISVWIDDEGQLRSEFDRYLMTINEEVHKSKAALRRWLNEWWPQMER